VLMTSLLDLLAKRAQSVQMWSLTLSNDLYKTLYNNNNGEEDMKNNLQSNLQEACGGECELLLTSSSLLSYQSSRLELPVHNNNNKIHHYIIIGILCFPQGV
jgi:hypothetical protein